MPGRLVSDVNHLLFLFQGTLAMLPGGTLSGARPPGKPEVARVTFQKNNCGMGLSIVAAKGKYRLPQLTKQRTNAPTNSRTNQQTHQPTHAPEK